MASTVPPDWPRPSGWRSGEALWAQGVALPQRGLPEPADGRSGTRNASPALTATRMIPKWYHFCVALTVRTDPALEEALTSLSEVEGTSRQEIIRRAVLDRYERTGHSSRVAQSTKRMVDRWGDVLERLGSE